MKLNNLVSKPSSYGLYFSVPANFFPGRSVNGAVDGQYSSTRICISNGDPQDSALVPRLSFISQLEFNVLSIYLSTLTPVP